MNQLTPLLAVVVGCFSKIKYGQLNYNNLKNNELYGIFYV